MNIIYSRLNGNILAAINNYDNLFKSKCRDLVSRTNGFILMEDDPLYKIHGSMNPMHYFPGHNNYQYSNCYELECQNCNMGDSEGCCERLQYDIIEDHFKYYIDLNTRQPVKKFKSQIELFALDKVTEFEVNPDYEEITVDTSDDPKIYAKVSFVDDGGNPVVFADKYMRCKITKGACKVINKTDETGVAWVELNINGQIGNNETFTVSSIDDGNTEEYTPFIGSSIKFTMLA